VGDVCISSITLAELMYGVQKSQYQKKNKPALDEFTSPLEIMPFDEEVAAYYGQIRASLEKWYANWLIRYDDRAHAQCLNSVLVTHNTKKFFRVPNLKVEDWTHN